jgi:hypothetical protein
VLVAKGLYQLPVDDGEEESQKTRRATDAGSSLGAEVFVEK